MPKLYKIRDGFTFVDSDNSVKSGGDQIELEDDVAALHQHKLERIKAEKAPRISAANGNGDGAGDANDSPDDAGGAGGADDPQ